MPKVTCRRCEGTGKRYPGFSDAPAGLCVDCNGTGIVTVAYSYPTVWAPFKFTPDEVLKARSAIYRNLLGVPLSGKHIDNVINAIESIINEETEQTS